MKNNSSKILHKFPEANEKALSTSYSLKFHGMSIVLWISNISSDSLCLSVLCSKEVTKLFWEDSRFSLSLYCSTIHSIITPSTMRQALSSLPEKKKSKIRLLLCTLWASDQEKKKTHEFSPNKPLKFFNESKLVLQMHIQMEQKKSTVFGDIIFTDTQLIIAMKYSINNACSHSSHFEMEVQALLIHSTWQLRAIQIKRRIFFITEQSRL